MRISSDTTFDNKNPYQVLGVPVGIDPVDLRKAYLGLAKKYHPNLFATDPEKYRVTTRLMQDINGAYELLSDPAQREFWDRKHLSAPKTVSRPEPKSSMYDSGLVDSVIRTYNEFVASLRTEAERKEASRRIKEFHKSRKGAAFIDELVARHYQKVMDFVRRGKRITMYDDGLVEIMFLYEGRIEVIPNDIFITYAYIVSRRDRRKPPAGPNPSKQEHVRPQEPRTGKDSRSAGAGPAKGLWARLWNWLVTPYRSRRS
jgi:curved DNA-binding protein CbpA